MKSSPKLFCDETRCPVLDPGRGKTKTGFLRAIARDDRPWGGTDPPAVLYSYAPGRGGVHAMKLLDGFAGVLLDPLAWMTDVLTKLVNLWPASRIDELMPWAYART